MNAPDFFKRLLKPSSHTIENERDLDIYESFCTVIKSREQQLWEIFPVLLANANENEEELFDLHNLDNLLLDKRSSDDMLRLIVLSLALYRFLGLKFFWAKKLYNTLLPEQQSVVKKLLIYFRENHIVKISGIDLNPLNIKKIFNEHFNAKSSKNNNIDFQFKELSFQQALSQIFSPKQKELFMKKLRKEKINKTETEYYSRIVKKKVVALANYDLHSAAKKLLEK